MPSRTEKMATRQSCSKSASSKSIKKLAKLSQARQKAAQMVKYEESETFTSLPEVESEQEETRLVEV
jgi:hypothetical protein